MIYISSYPEYEYCVNRGYEPLLDWRMFQIDIKLRVEIQKSIFGAANFQQENQKFYRWVWDRKIQVCEESARPLYNYSSEFISHIITKGADRRMAIDPRNVNILYTPFHNIWDRGTESDRMKMNIYILNQYVINLLKTDYNSLSKL